METIHYRTPKKTTTVANVPVIDLYGTDLTTGDEKRVENGKNACGIVRRILSEGDRRRFRGEQ